MSELSIPSEFRRFPSQWKVMPFLEVISDETGGNPKILTSNYQDSGILPVIDQGNSAIAGYVDDVSLKCKAKLPCILFGDHTKNFKFVDHPFALGADGVKVLIPSVDLDSKFAFHYLKQVRLPDNAGYSRHYKFLKETYIPLPPLPEQKRIAAILDKADSIRRKQQEAVRLTEELLRSVFLEMFGDPVTNPKGWKTRAFVEVCETRLGKMLDANQQTGEHLRPYLRNSNVQWDRIETSDLELMDFKEKDRKTFSLKDGDVLICEGGEVGRAAIWRNQMADCYFQKAIHRARPNQSVALPEYVMFWLWFMSKNGGFKDHVTSATIAHLTGEKLKEIQMTLPPISLQKKYQKVYNSFFLLKNSNKLYKDETNKLFASLIKTAFSGCL